MFRRPHQYLLPKLYSDFVLVNNFKRVYGLIYQNCSCAKKLKTFSVNRVKPPVVLFFLFIHVTLYPFR